MALIILIIKIHKNGRNGMSVRYVKKEKIKMLSIVWFQEIHKLEVHAFKSRGLSIGSQQDAFIGASWGLPRKVAGKRIWINFEAQKRFVLHFDGFEKCFDLRQIQKYWWSHSWSHWGWRRLISQKLGALTPIHLYLIFEKSSLKNQVWRTGFFTCKKQF